MNEANNPYYTFNVAQLPDIIARRFAAQNGTQNSMLITVWIIQKSVWQAFDCEKGKNLFATTETIWKYKNFVTTWNPA